jgi:hypothetical protein
MNDQQVVKWELTPQEAQYIAELLNARPHGEVRGLIDKLTSQANRPQLEAVKG